jgi:hypothetical protein
MNWPSMHNYRYGGLNMPHTAQVIGNHVNEGAIATITYEVGYGSNTFMDS